MCLRNGGRYGKSKFVSKERGNQFTDGRRLGYVSDADVNFDDGRLEAIVVSGNCETIWRRARSKSLVSPLISKKNW